MKKSSLCAPLIGLAALSAAASPLTETTLLRLPPMPEAPVIDGKIADDEWRYASTSFGGISNLTSLMTYRENNFRIGYDRRNFYVSVSSEMPLAPQTLTEKDAIEIRLQAPGKDQPVVIRFDSAGKGQLPAGVKVAGGFAPDLVNREEGKCWNAEAMIPASVCGVPEIKDGDKWGLQIIRHWSSDDEQGAFHQEQKPGELATFIADSAAPAVSFDGFGTSGNYRSTGNYLWTFRMENPGKKPLSLISRCERMGITGEATLDIAHPDLTGKAQKHRIGFSEKVEPGKTGFFQFYMMAQFPGKPQFIRGDISDKAGTTFYRRAYFYELSKSYKKASYRETRGLPFLSAGFYPSFGNKLRVAATFSDKMPCVFVKIQAKDSAGKVLWQYKKSDFGRTLESFETETALPGLPLGDYTVTMTSTTDKGEKLTHTRTFSIRKFPWQGLNLGRDRVIIPPFKPLAVDKKAHEVRALLTGYKINGELWDAVYAEGENILASPVRFTLDGMNFTNGKTKLVSAEKDRVVYETTAENDKATLKITQDYDYDGFCLATIKVIPRRTVEVSDFALQIPLKDSVVNYYSSLGSARPRVQGKPDYTIPAGEGELPLKAFNRNKGKVRNYFWFGGVYKGFSIVIPGAKNFSLDAGKIAEKLTRQDGVITYTQSIVNKKTLWEKPFELVIAFEPTPVKPQPGEYRRISQDQYTGPTAPGSVKAGGMSTTQWQLGYPYAINVLPNGDDGYLKFLFSTRGRRTVPGKECNDFADQFMARNAEWLRKHAPLANTYTMHRAFHRPDAYGDDYFLLYHNPAFYSFRWPEAEMYKAEWTPWDYPVDDCQDEYLAVQTDEYNDKMLWEMREQIRQGFDGMNFDCFPMGGGYNTMTNNAVRTGPGKVPFLCNANMYYCCPPGITSGSTLLHWRSLMKRTATLLYVENKLVFGVPWVDLHTTNAEAVPVAAWCATAITTECGGAGPEFPERFPEGYVLADLAGTQCGLIPRPIVSAQGRKVDSDQEMKTLISWSFAHALMNHCDQGLKGTYPDYRKVRAEVFTFGYGKKENRTLPCYGKEKQPVTFDAKNVRSTQVIRPDGQALLMIGNLGNAVTTKFDLSGLNYGKCEVIDVMTGKVLTKSEVALEKYGFALLKVVKK